MIQQRLPRSVRASAVTAVLLAPALALGACSDSADGEAASTATGAAGSRCDVYEADGVQVKTFCGEGTMTVEATGVDLELAEASCEKADAYLSVNAGTIVLGSGANAAKVKAATQYAGLTVGRIPGDTTSKPASADGVYTGAVLSANDRGKALLPNAATVKVTLKDDRSAGTFTASLVGGGTVTGSFSC